MKNRTLTLLAGGILIVAASAYFYRARHAGQSFQSPPEDAAIAAAEDPAPESLSRALVPEPPSAPKPASDAVEPSPSPTNRLAGLLREESDIALVPREQIERWLALNKTNAESLLAADQAGEDPTLLLTALANFPNDPRVLFSVAARDRLPEARRELLDRLKAAAPDNALADYLSARDYLKNAQPGLALQDLLTASQKTRFDDYTLESVQSREDLYLQAGRSPAEAKAVALSNTLLPHLSQLKGLAQDMAALQQQFLAGGDSASAEALARVGLQMGEQLNAGEGARCSINQLVGTAVERIVLGALDPQTHYDFLNGTVQERLDSLQTQRDAVRESTQSFDRWWPTASEAEVISYFDRMKLYGESAALAWLQHRQSAP